MSFTVAAIVVGVVFGLARGGRLGNVGRQALQISSLLMISVAAQALAELLDLDNNLGLAIVLVSYLGLALFAMANIRLVGMSIALVGLLCNLAVITVNGGMPVRASSIVAAEAAEPGELETLDFGAKRHLAGDDDRLTFLGDIIPVRATGEVLSYGDLILAFGIANVIFRLLAPAGHRRRPHSSEPPPADQVVIDLDEAEVRHTPGELLTV